MASLIHQMHPLPPQSSPEPSIPAPPGAPDVAGDLRTTSDSTATLRRLSAPGLELMAVEAGPLVELHATATPVGNEPPEFTVRRLAALLNAWDAIAVRTIAFGSVKSAAATHAALRQSLDDPGTPMTWVEGGACDARPLAGIQVHAVAGTQVTTLAQGRTIGRLWKDASATHCVFSGLGAQDTSAPRIEQAHASLGVLAAELARAGMTFNDVVRTWFYLEDILDWYRDFNRARNEFFLQARLGPGNVPASTGVSSRNPGGSAVALSAWGIKPHDPSAIGVRMVPSPRQCPAPAYGSAFSRAVEVQSPGFRQLLVSGTASIGPAGETKHVGDVAAQIECTMEVIQAILESRGMTLANTTRSTAYFRSGLDVARFVEWLERHELRSLPVVNACCDICRDDLLFELELDAIAVR
jgi:enamine deaminase RidA (YjgF/YER057c/UK114 family)